MHYVFGDIHGCFDKYSAMLEKIRLCDDDTLYMLGDVIDRGPDGIRILFDMMGRHNVIPLLGNHELMAYSVLSKLCVEIDEDNFDTHLDEGDMENMKNWMLNGGFHTQEAFSKLDFDDKISVLDYIGEFSLHETVHCGGRDFVLVHGGISNFSPEKSLDEYDVHDLVWDRCDYDRVYFEDKLLVTGHTPTILIDERYYGKIYSRNNHIAIDCGAVFGYKLGCICLETLDEFYV